MVGLAFIEVSLVVAIGLPQTVLKGGTLELEHEVVRGVVAVPEVVGLAHGDGMFTNFYTKMSHNALTT